MQELEIFVRSALIVCAVGLGFMALFVQDPLDQLAFTVWGIGTVIMVIAPKETATEYIVVTAYITAIILSVADVYIINKILTAIAFCSWGIFMLIGFTIKAPADFPLIAQIIALKNPEYSHGMFIIILSAASVVILLLELWREINIQKQMKTSAS